MLSFIGLLIGSMNYPLQEVSLQQSAHTIFPCVKPVPAAIAQLGMDRRAASGVR